MNQGISNLVNFLLLLLLLQVNAMLRLSEYIASFCFFRRSFSKFRRQNVKVLIMAYVVSRLS